ncbi:MULTISPECIES: S8 family serine peptidase [unclassified Carboxylicivirga]|uniref:S8 family serine peptidase n=1 Tax=Carboxylicivirga TaxID=1628153 RepID=UPI003D332475
MKQYILLLSALMLVLVACSRSTIDDDLKSLEQEAAPIINVPQGAIKGEILVKFNGTATSAFEKVALKSAGIGLKHSGLEEVDRVLTQIGTRQLKRVFPVDKSKEMQTREKGLNRWYVVHFDEAADLQKVARQLAGMEGVDKVQYSHPIRRAYNPEQRATGMQPATKAALKQSRVAGFNDPGLAAQWGYVNNGRLLADGTTNQYGDEIVQAIQGMDVGCKEAWELCTGDPSIIVAVLDEGVMFNHPDLKANMWVNEGETFASDEDADGNGYAGDRYGFNFVTDRGLITYNGPMDTGHGTHVAGTIAAVNNNGTGVSGVAGGDGTVNSGVKIMSCQVFDNSRSVSMYQEAMAIKYAADNGAVVLQCSWGYNSGLANPIEYMPGFTSDEQWLENAPLEKEALDYFIHNAGSPNGVIDGGIVVFASGNESAAMAGYPSAYPDYISVTSLAADGTPSCFSNYGHGASIAAPGGDGDYHLCDEGKILSTVPPFEGEYYGYMEGTSMACPHVSGVVALGLSYAAQLNRHFRADEFRNMVMNAVSDATLESYFADTKTYYINYANYGFTAPMQMQPESYKGQMGAGIINAYKLLKAVEGAGVEMKVPNVLVAVEGLSRINFARYFTGSQGLTFSCRVTDQSVATASTDDQVTFSFSGLMIGSTMVTVKASDGREQTFYITVRNGDGWL